MIQLAPGDLAVVRTPGLPSWVIRFGEMLQGKPDLRNHVAMFHHSENGVNFYLEGRPSGFGWKAYRADADEYAGSPWTVTNAAQPKTPDQRTAVCADMEKLLGAPYDWEAIEGDTADAFRLPEVWAKWGDGTSVPGHVVCSSAAAWAYERAGLAAPGSGDARFVEPADFDLFIETEAWSREGPVST